MDLSVNGEALQVAEGTTVAALLVGLGRGPKGLAVAVNGEVVPRSSWGVAPVRSGDRVEVLSACQGG